MLPRCVVLFLSFLWALSQPVGAGAEPGRIAGLVLDAENRQPVRFVNIAIYDSSGTSLDTVSTGPRGTFAFALLHDQPYSLSFSRIGYRHNTLRGIVPEIKGAGSLIVILVPATYVMQDTVVISASRGRDTGLSAPAATSVVGRAELEEARLFTAVDLVRTVTGVDFASKGMFQHTFAVRGHRSVNSGALLVMSDYRYSAVPALDINVPYLLAVTNEDLNRIEVARGPSSALYGPNSDRGILHLITRSPFESRGTSVSLGLGERNVMQGRVRHAGVMGSKLGYKVSAEYFRGDDWEYADSTEERRRQDEIDHGADPDTLRIGSRDHRSKRAAGEARIDWAPSSRSSFILRGGVAKAVNTIDLTTLGAVQVQDWLYPYVQLQTEVGRFSSNLFYNGSNSGDTFSLRTGDAIVDESSQVGIQLQHGANLGSASRLLYGFDARRTEPRTGETINGRNERNDTMSELGAYLNVNGSLGEKINLVGALRVDYHDRINDTVLSPRLATIYKPSDSQSFRITYNRAFSSPDATALFGDLRVGSLDALPYDVRVSSVPKDGFTFTRGCDGGPCMQNPWGLPPSLPADATLTWGVLQGLVPGLSGIPAPNASQVGTDLRSLDPDRGFVPIEGGDVVNIPGPARVIRNSLEVGYKAVLSDRAAVSADVYWTHVKDNQGPPWTATPNVFLDRESLEAYLRGFMSSDSAATLADSASGIPMGTVSPDEIGASSDVLRLTRQVDDYTYSFWGIDLWTEVSLSRRLTLGGNYSFFHDNVIEGVDVVGTVTLGVPNHKGAAWLRFRNERAGWAATLRGRALDGFLVDSGVFRGEVKAYAVLDLEIGYRFTRNPKVVLSLDAANIFDKRHQEYVGAPDLGRHLLVQLQVGL